MSKVDPTGYSHAIATIEKGALSERQQRIAVGVAMLRDGATYRQASAAAKVPIRTLWDYANRGQAIMEREGKADYNVAAVTEVSLDISLMAAEHVRDRLAAAPEEWSNMDLVKAYGIATDKLIALSQRVTGGASDALPALSKLLSGSKVTIEPSEQGRAIEAERIE